MKKRNLVLFGTVATLSLALAGSIGAVTASAAGQELSPSGNTGTIEISYTQADSWKVTLPESITVNGEAAKVEATDVNIVDGSTLTVTLKGTDENGWKLTENQGSKTIDYTVKKGDSSNQDTTVNVNDAILEVESSQQSGEAYLKVEVEGNKSTGNKEYKDTLTFTVTVE